MNRSSDFRSYLHTLYLDEILSKGLFLAAFIESSCSLSRRHCSKFCVHTIYRVDRAEISEEFFDDLSRVFSIFQR